MAEPAVLHVDPARDALDRAYQYAHAVRSGEITACIFVKQAVERWFRDLETAHERGLVFDENAAGRVFRFIGKYCRHYQGRKWRGRVVELSDWQCFIVANVFGWLREDGTRRFRYVYEEVARKNGKTTKLAAIGLYLLMADGEPGAKIYSAATKRDQAKEIFQSIGAMAEEDPKIRQHVKVQRNIILAPQRSEVLLLSADYNTMDGFNVHAGLVDELHAHRDSGIWDVLDSGKGARTQPIMWGITTAGRDHNSFCYEQRGYAVKVLDGTVEDDSFFAIIFTLDADDDWEDESVWIKSNPNLGISVSLDDMRDQARKAKEMPSARNEFQMKRLNVWVYGETAWMNMERWNACRNPDLDELGCWESDDGGELAGATAYGGLDLASVEDLCAFGLVFPMPDGKRRMLVRGYIPEFAFQNRLKKGGFLRSAYLKFEESGLLTVTPGEVTDYNFIKADIIAACEKFDIREIGFDRFNASQLVSDLLEEDVPMVAVGQGTGSMNAPMKEIMRLALSGLIEHNNPLLSFAMSNVVTEENSAGDIRPAKNKVAEKIDPAVAIMMAVGRMMANQDDDYLDEPVVML